MPQSHPYRSLHIPNDAPFELRPSPGKGWGAFATRNIKQGSIIFKEKPLFIIRKPHQEIAEQDVKAAFQQLTPSEKKQFLCLRDNASGPFTYMTEAMAENSFAIPQDNGSTIHGVYLLHSRFNHSCIPNFRIPTTKEETISSFAVRDISTGEEMTFSYNDFNCQTRHERHESLRFVCDCKACLSHTPFQQLSDMRRIFIRGLLYLTHGVDINGQKQSTSSSPIIFDPELKKAAETFEIPLSSRLIYGLLLIILHEQEGLLDDFRVQGLNSSVLGTTAYFQTEGNVRIVRLAMAQKTWLERFCTAMRLYGRADAADNTISMALRKIRGISV